MCFKEKFAVCRRPKIRGNSRQARVRLARHSSIPRLSHIFAIFSSIRHPSALLAFGVVDRHTPLAGFVYKHRGQKKLRCALLEKCLNSSRLPSFALGFKNVGHDFCWCKIEILQKFLLPPPTCFDAPTEQPVNDFHRQPLSFPPSPSSSSGLALQLRLQ